MADRQPDPVRVTTAALSHTADLRLRQRRYLMTQGVRVICVLLAVLLPVDVVWKIGFLAGSIVLPWFGVVAANAGPTVERRRASAVVPAPQPASLPPAAEPGRIIDAER